ncbi:MAG: response regulator [Methylococcales bacterium]
MTKILVVDDDLLALATTTMGLQELGYKVLKAHNGAMALQICAREKQDLVLIDIRMPNMSGFDVAKLLNEQMIPFIFLSAYSDEEMIKDAADLGAFGYLIKPIEVSKIVPIIEVVLTRAQEVTKTEQMIENLTNILEKNREIDISIGLLMERYQISRVTAFEYLRNYARSHRLKVIDVAKALLTEDIKHFLDD